MPNVTAKKIPHDDFDVELRLPRQVAVSLFAVLRLVGGNPSTSYRAHTDEVEQALRDVLANDKVGDARFNGSIYAEQVTP